MENHVSAAVKHVRALAAPAFLTQAETIRRMKILADRVLLVVTVGTLAWALVSATFLKVWHEQDAATLSLHLVGGPGVVEIAYPDGIRHHPTASNSTTASAVSTITVTVTIFLRNYGPKGITIRAASLSGPYLTGDTALTPAAAGYVDPARAGRVEGNITVQCAAAGSVVTDTERSVARVGQRPTVLTLTVVTKDKKSHRVALIVDTTAYAIQGRACA
jgi:hypothetical protein